MSKPFASFCFSTFKRPDFLRDTLHSVLNQTLQDFEVIVSDNDTEESGRAAVEGMNDPRFRYFSNGANLGMKKSFNKSLERATGEYIVMIADDDPVYPDMLKTLFDLQQEFPGYGVYMGGCDWYCLHHEVAGLYNMKVGTNSCLSGVHDVGYKKAYGSKEFIKHLFNFGIFPHYLWSTTIIRRSVLIEMGGVPEYGTPFLGDYAYMSVMASHSGCVIINKSIGCQTLHNENFGRKQNEQIAVTGRQFPAYLESKIAPRLPWDEVKDDVYRFTALWMVEHMAFLHHYYIKSGIEDKSLRDAEKEVFALDYVKRYRFKYFLKKKSPGIHRFLVWLKKQFKGKDKPA
ncbi:MAG: glycosyltransferase family A protein [Bacteroidetes bacterium]|nr:glycosyltransferase family A protein [Bacteroidota bacterium]